jgi:cyclase
MNRSICALLFPLALAGAASAQDFSQVAVQTVKLTDSVYMLVGAGGNVGLSVGPDSVFMIDDQFAPMAPKLKAAVAALTNRPVQFLLNTHFHFDHSGGNEAFGQAGAVIVAHDNVRRRMSSEQLISFIGMRQAASPRIALPVVTVPGELKLHVNGDEVHAFHVAAAHTDGDLVVRFVQSNVVHMGDTFFNGMYPFIDFGSGGTPDGVIAAYDRVLALADAQTKIIPGHGPLAAKADLQAARDMLATVTARIKAARQAGKSNEEIAAGKPAAEYDARYGGGFIKADQFVQMMLGAIPR